MHLETKIYELEQQKQALVIGIQADELMLGKVQQEVVTQQVELTDLQASIKSYQAQQNIEAAQKHQSLSYELVHLETKIYELEQQKQALVIGISK